MANYKVYCVGIDDWTAEMESRHDYIKVYNNKVYFMSKRKENVEMVIEPPMEIGGWIAACQISQIMQDDNKQAEKNFKKGKTQLEKDFENNLQAALADMEKEKAVIANGKQSE